MVTTEERPQEAKKQAALSRELSEFLIELSIAVHRFSMYPSDHPSLGPASENVISGLASLLKDRPTLWLGVAQKQLMIDGVATDERHPVLSDLARRLHAHQLGALSFSSGATLDEVLELLRTVASEPERGTRPIGLLPEEARPTWEHVTLLPIGYDRLQMQDSSAPETQGKSQQLWLSLARSVMDDEGLEAPPEGSSLAAVIERRAGDAAYDKVIVNYLLQLADELKGSDDAQVLEIRKQMSQLVRDMDEATLQRLIKLGGGSVDRKRFLMDANQGGMAVDSVVKILGAAAEAEGQTISSSLTRLLSKLSVHADHGAKGIRAGADSAIRENVEALISDWELEDPNPDAYTQVLDRMSKAVPVLEGPHDEEGQELPGSDRVIQMALELDAYGQTVRKAVAEMLDEGEVPRLLELLDAAPEKSGVAEMIRSHLMTPQQLRRMLSGDDVDDESLKILVERLGSTAVDPLFQYLTESESRSVRRKIFDVLSKMGETVTPVMMEHLKDERWFVKRNMLALMQRLDQLPEKFTPVPYIQHDDPRVRREIFPLAFRMPEHRTRALASALADADERIVRMALLEVQDGIPETLVPVVVGRVLGEHGVPALRSLAVRALGQVSSNLALEALLQVCTAGKSILGKPRLAQKTPELLPALSALAARWRADERARAVILLAEKSKDGQIQSAVRGEAAA